MDVLTAIRTRRSAGTLGGEVPRKTIELLLDAAVRAPNHHLTQPWRFAVVQGAARERLGAYWAQLAAEELAVAKDARDEFVAGQARKLLRAPVLVVVAVRTDPDPVVAAEDHSATAAAIENLLLAAHACGLGATWRTGKLAYAPAVAAYLGFDPGCRILGVIYVGVPSGPSPIEQERATPAVRWLS
jgi:nitroreductase